MGLVCVAAPVLDRDGTALAAISIAGPVMRLRPETHVPAVRAAAAGLGALLARQVR